MHEIKQDIEAILGVERMRRIAALARLRRAWPRIVGPMLASGSEPLALHEQEDGSFHMVVAVNHSILAQQVVFLREEIRRACLRECRIERIARIFTRMQAGAGLSVNSPIAPPSRRVPLQRKKQWLRQLRAVRDRHLRKAMFDAWLAWEQTREE